MKPFDLEAAKRGAKLVWHDGREAHFVAYVLDVKPECALIIRVGDDISCLTKEGMHTLPPWMGGDIQYCGMAPEMYWVNVYVNGGNAFYTKRFETEIDAKTHTIPPAPVPSGAHPDLYKWKCIVHALRVEEE